MAEPWFTDYLVADINNFYLFFCFDRYSFRPSSQVEVNICNNK